MGRLDGCQLYETYRDVEIYMRPEDHFQYRAIVAVGPIKESRSETDKIRDHNLVSRPCPLRSVMAVSAAEAHGKVDELYDKYETVRSCKEDDEGEEEIIRRAAQFFAGKVAHLENIGKGKMDRQTILRLVFEQAIRESQETICAVTKERDRLNDHITWMARDQAETR